jgi:hypothetical protein
MKKKKEETTKPFIMDCYSERPSSFNIFLIGFGRLN